MAVITKREITSAEFVPSLLSEEFLEKDLVSFVSSSTKRKICSKYVNHNDFFLSIEEMRDIWRELLVDSINFLRVNDRRERSLFDLGETYDERSVPLDEAGAKSVRYLNSFGIEELYGYFEEFTDFESILYGADSFYRDHVKHPLLVWLIGLSVLDDSASSFTCRVAHEVIVVPARSAHVLVAQENGDSSVNKSQIGNADNGINYDCEKISISSAELGAMWTIVALTHDLGYPLQKVDRINSKLSGMLEKFGRVGFRPADFSFGAQHSHLSEHLLQVLSSSLNSTDGEYHTRVRPKYYAKFSKSWEVFDHGFVSSLILLKSLTFFLETDLTYSDRKSLSSDDARQFSVRAEVLHAVAAHTTPKVYHLGANNLAFLLLLCDDLHEWDRPMMSDLRSGKLTGGANKVTIEKCEIGRDASDIVCMIEYPEAPYGEQKRHVARVFRAWHERMRPAVFDKERKMKFVWKMNFDNAKAPWSFELDSGRSALQQVEVMGPQNEHSSVTRRYDIYAMDQ